jgi:hypothetical protein
MGVGHIASIHITQYSQTPIFLETTSQGPVCLSNTWGWFSCQPNVFWWVRHCTWPTYLLQMKYLPMCICKVH